MKESIRHITNENPEFNNIMTYYNRLLQETNKDETYEHIMTFNEHGERWPDHYSRRITKIHKNRVSIKIIHGQLLLTLQRCWNTHNFSDDHYFKLNNNWYYHQEAKTNSWGTFVPERFIEVSGEPTTLIDYFEHALYSGTSVKADKKCLIAIENFLGITNNKLVKIKY